MPDTETLMVFEISCPNMEFDARAQMHTLLAALGDVEDGNDSFTLRATVEKVASDYGDYGPEEWSSAMVDLAERSELGDEAHQVLTALALDAWFEDVSEVVAYFGAFADVPVPATSRKDAL